MTNKIIMQKETLVEAKGNLRGGRCKPVVCLSTGEVFTSATDAAKHNGVSIYAISTACLGKTKTANKKKWCYEADLSNHLPELLATLQTTQIKAKAYDAEMYKKQRISTLRQDRAKAEIELAKMSKKYNQKIKQLNVILAEIENLEA